MGSNIIEKVSILKKIKQACKSVESYTQKIIYGVLFCNILIVLCYLINYVNKIHVVNIIIGLFFIFISTMSISCFIEKYYNKEENKKLAKYAKRYELNVGINNNDDLVKLSKLIESLYPYNNKKMINDLVYNPDLFKTEADYVRLFLENNITNGEIDYDIMLFQEDVVEIKNLLDKENYEGIFISLLDYTLRDIKKRDFFQEKNNIIDIVEDFEVINKNRVVDIIHLKLSHFNKKDKSEKNLNKKINKIKASKMIKPLIKNPIFKIKDI